MPSNLITNGTFAGSSLTGWTVSGSMQGSYGNQAVFGASDTPTNGVLSQVVSVTAGDNFSFDYGFANAGGATGSVSGTYEIVTEPGGAPLHRDPSRISTRSFIMAMQQIIQKQQP